MMRRRMEAFGDAALWIDAARRVTSGFKREDARNVGLQRDGLQIEHQLHVLVERVGHARRSARELSLFSARVACLDALYPPLDLPNVFGVALHALPIGSVEPPGEIG